MAGTPVKNALLKKIAESGGEAALLERLANGETLRSVADSWGVSRNFLSLHLNRDPERKTALAAARIQCGEALGEQILSIADAADKDTERVARLRIETRRMLAARFDPANWSDHSGPHVTVNFNQLHLDALRRVRAEDIAAKGLPPFSATIDVSV